MELCTHTEVKAWEAFMSDLRARYDLLQWDHIDCEDLRNELESSCEEQGQHKGTDVALKYQVRRQL